MPTDSQYEAMERLQWSIDFSRQFPENVFRGQWIEMLFFDCDRIFHREFANLARELLLAEGASSICMCGHHQSAADSPETQSFFFLDEGETPELYISFLAREWIVLMGRFGLISNVGRWCIYTERAQEFAVIAIRDSAIRESARPIIDKLGALRIESALENPPSFGLTSRGLTQEGRKRLIEAYQASNI
jgi:hypothetical protein